MAGLAFVVLILGVCLPAALSRCPEEGDNKVDWTKEDQTWYYCQSSLKGRKYDNCYVDFKKTEKGLDAVVYQTTAGSGDPAKDEFKMTSNGKGEYNYPGKKTQAINMKVSADGKCVTYWKCPRDDGAWNGARGGSDSYFMFMCKEAGLCQKQGDYKDDYKTIFDAAVKDQKLDGKIDDTNQETCKKAYPGKY